jgi:PAS domain S-box-containing protein
MAEVGSDMTRANVDGKKTARAPLVGLAAGLILSAIVFFLTYEVDGAGVRPWANSAIVLALSIISMWYLRSMHMRANAAHALADRRLSELEDANIRFRAILSAAPDPLLFIDANGIVQDVNPPFQKMFGYAPSEVIGKTVEMLMAPALRDHFSLNCFDYMKSSRLQRMGVPQDFTVLTKGGTELAAEIIINPVVMERGTMVTAIVRDVSARKKAEVDLRRSEHLLAASQRITHVGSWEADLVNKTVYRSAELFRIFGHAEASGGSFEDVVRFNAANVHPDDRPIYDRGVQQVLASGNLEPHEYRIFMPDGRIKYLRSQSEAVYNDRGELVKAVGTTQDITAEKKIQDDLRCNERRLAEAQKVAQLGSWERDRTDTVHWSEGLCAIYNMSPVDAPRTPAEAMALTWKSVHPEDRPRMEKLFRTIRDNVGVQNPIELEYRLALPDGAVKYVRSRVVREFDERGDLLKATGIVQDVTARKLAKMRIENTEAQLRTLTNNLPVFVAYIDAEETVLFINETGAKWCGRASPADIIGGKLKHAGSGKNYEATAPLRIRCFGGETLYEEILMDFNDGAARWIGMQLVPDFTPERSVRGLYILLSDIDGRKRMEQRLVQSQKIEAIGQLTGGIAHDFNNILTVIRGNLQMVNLPPEMLEAAKRIDRAVTACGQASDLVSRLLTFARQQDLRPGIVAVSELIRNIVKLLRGSLAENIAIDAVLPPERLWTHADPSQLESALVNLCLNARDAMPRGGRITITAHTRNDVFGVNAPPSTKDYVCISVADTGIGMTDDVKTRALEPFFTTKDFGEGSGLGLSMVHGFVEQSGGTLRIDSERNKGTTVHLYLPASSTAGDESKAVPAPVPQQGGAHTILVVEDREELREMVASFLGTLRYRVMEARDGAQALSMLEQGGKFDLLFTDIIMPGGINGTELAQYAQGLAPDMRVLYTTGYVRDGEAAALGESAHILRKPYALSELATAVKRALAP